MPSNVEQIHGLFNVNKKILSALSSRHTDRAVRAYCCLDRESRYASTPDFDLDLVRQKTRDLKLTNVVSVDAIIATQMIESWFLYDLAGIYRYLRVPKARRNMKAYSPPEAFRVSDLKELFRRHGKTYCEGRRARHFIERLDMAGIVRGSRALGEGIRLIVSQGRQ